VVSSTAFSSALCSGFVWWPSSSMSMRYLRTFSSLRIWAEHSRAPHYMFKFFLVEQRSFASLPAPHSLSCSIARKDRPCSRHGLEDRLQAGARLPLLHNPTSCNNSALPHAGAHLRLTKA
jgi:hypothetical protein